MKYLALVMVVLTLAFVAYGIHLYLNTSVHVVSVEVSSQLASETADMLQADIAAIQTNAFTGRLFQNQMDPNEEYYYVTYILHLHNGLLLDIDAIEAQVLPKTGDVFQRHTQGFVNINKQEDGSISATVLSKKSTLGVRDFIITYYVWGIAFVLQHTYG